MQSLWVIIRNVSIVRQLCIDVYFKYSHDQLNREPKVHLGPIKTLENNSTLGMSSVTVTFTRYLIYASLRSAYFRMILF